MQSKKQSLIESMLNTTSGFIISMFLTYYILPVFGFSPSVGVSFQITAIYTVVSIARSYVWRRTFNHIHKVQNEQR